MEGEAGGIEDMVATVATSDAPHACTDESCSHEDWPADTKQYRAKVEGLADDIKALTDDDSAREDEPTSPAIDIYKLFAKLIEDQAEAVAAKILPPGKAAKRGKAVAADVPDDDETGDILDTLTTAALLDALIRAMGEAQQAGGNAGLERLRAVAPTNMTIEAAFDVTNPKVAESIRQDATRLAKDINATTAQRIRSTLAEGLDKGESTRELAERVRATGESMSKQRAELIARDQSAEAYGRGQHAVWEETGVVSGRKFLMAPGACPVCQAVNKRFGDKAVPLDRPFFKKGESITGTDGRVFKFNYKAMNTGKVHLRCRCDSIPVVIESGGE